MTDFDQVQQRMRALERDVQDRTIGQAISEILGCSLPGRPADPNLISLLAAELRRADEIAYAAGVSEGTIGLRQGVILARAVQDVRAATATPPRRSIIARAREELGYLRHRDQQP